MEHVPVFTCQMADTIPTGPFRFDTSTHQPYLRMRTHSGFILSALILVLSSCDRSTCKNQDPIFDRSSYDSQEYKQELADRIDQLGMDDLHYWFDSYVQQNGNDYILVDIQNDSLCAKGMIQVKDWSMIEGIKRTKGASYKGAELKGLSFEVTKDSAGIEFIYKTLDRIVD